MKRVFDIVVSVSSLLILAPVLIIVSILVAIYLGNPILFSQIRPGLNAKPFRMFKFRTMTNERDAENKLLPNEKRMTRFGNFLRSTSLDELPELVNVLKGDMSIVGPRPLLMDYLPYFTKEQAHRHSIKPGITGWSQVNGRNAIGWEEKLKLDIWYVNNQSFWLDVKIIWMTLRKVIIREGVSHEGHVTMPRFDEYVKQQNLKM